ncbi:MAG: ChaN family lipoprotein [Desulfobacteraceae bacterium]|jgi:uncharacterized iron-regulated protein
MIYSFHQRDYISFEEFIREISNYGIIIIGENHDSSLHHENQRDILNRFSDFGPLDAGLEAIEWTHQELLDEFTGGTIDELKFLDAIKWNKAIPFSFYAPLITAAVKSGGFAYGLNAPPSIARRIALEGVDGLTAEERQILPPDFKIGSELYFQLFQQKMRKIQHPKMGSSWDRLFAAHSLWDDTMAYQALKHCRQGIPFFIIAGNFHVFFKLGISARIAERSNNKISSCTIIQVSSAYTTPEEIEEYTKPHSEFGIIGDYMIITNT